MIEENLIETFDEIFKHVITPLFTDRGFKRKAHHFARQIKDVVQTVHVQKSRNNVYTKSQTFSFIYGFYNQEISRIALGRDVELTFPKMNDCFIESCIGVITDDKEFWYEVNNEVDKDELAIRVKFDLTEFLFPLFDTFDSLENLTVFIEKYYKNIFPSPYSIIVFYMITHQREKGIAAIKDNYTFATTPQILRHSIVSPSGEQLDSSEFADINQSYVDKIEELAKLYNVIL